MSGRRSVEDWQRPAVLLLTRDASLIDRIGELVTAAGLSMSLPMSDGASTADAQRSAQWSPTGSPLVLIGADVVEEVHAESMTHVLTRRPVVVAEAADSDQVSTAIWRAAMELGSQRVAVLPQAEAWLLDVLLDHAAAGQRIGRVVGVLAGRGGGGATVLVSALATTARAAGLRVMVIDLDPLGGGVDLTLAGTQETGWCWQDLIHARGRIPSGVLSTGLPTAQGVRVLTWGERVAAVPVSALQAVLAAAARESDLVLLDLPRGVTELSQCALQRCDRTFLVVPAEVRAAAAAAAMIAEIAQRVPERPVDLDLIVRGPAPTGLDAETIADSLDLPLYADLRAEPGLAAALDRGHAPPVRRRGPLSELCRRIVSEMS